MKKEITGQSETGRIHCTMRILVTYWTQTGNTRLVARAIFDSLHCDKELKSFGEVESLEGYDLTFIGFPVMRFGPVPAARTFINTHAAGKKIALFVTHAMPVLGQDPTQQALLEKELEKCRKACTHAALIGMYHCQGELSASFADELRNSNIPMLSEFAAMRPLTIGHPDQNELEQAKNFARALITP
jgi:flavodoxin